MTQARENLLFANEPIARARILDAIAHELDRHRAGHALHGPGGLEHRGHAAAAELAQDDVAGDVRRRRMCARARLRQHAVAQLAGGGIERDREQFAQVGDAARERFADRAGGVVGLAAEAFNDGLRAYYFAFAAAGWLFSPWAFVLASAGVVWVLYMREFRSEALALMRD